MRRDPNLLRAIEVRPDSSLLDEGGKPDAAISSAAAELLLLAAQPVVVHHREQAVVAAFERQLGEDDTAGAARIHLASPRIVAAPQLCRVQIEPSRGQIDELLR